ncbi:2-oxoglutarate synthase subunit KorB [uncultured delta proteobacterium]|uniref:2-oxoglutarate synthase subunit KorB n=1 Tax=uncultured delta proteobacterium TaxID=34034 RepID=A0A212JB97_9DELT|nr:2-oxoglutarate synthase subunit KorB [uncultured delta proteobacterium]
MSVITEHPLRKYMRPHVTRTTTCPGCGIGIVSQAFLRAVDSLGIDFDDCVFVAGIGCSAWIPTPLYNGDTLHTTHGRPVAFATGVKASLPDKHVVVLSGDGDLSAIGGNHLIHAARRNIDMTVVLINNSIYGMTGGQAAPTTPAGTKTITSPYGFTEHDFNLSELVKAAGASYVARWTTAHPVQLSNAIKAGLQKKGFSFIEAVSQCPVQYGRASKLGSARAMLRSYKDRSVTLKKAEGMSAAELEGKLLVGEFQNIDKPEFTDSLARARAIAQGGN